jgi:chromosome segregation ATPase
LYQIDQNIDQFISKINEAKMNIHAAEKIKQLKEDTVANLKNQLNTQQICFKELDEELENAQNKLSKYSSKTSELVQKISHCENSIKKIERNLIKAKNIDKVRQENIKDLKQQYWDVEKNKENYVKSQTQPCSIKLKDEQVI